MRFLIDLLISTFVITTNAVEFDSTSIGSKIINGDFVEESPIQFLICSIKYDKITKGLGLFINRNNFLTAASILFTNKLSLKGYIFKKVDPKKVIVEMDSSSGTSLFIKYFKGKQIITMDGYNPKSGVPDIAIIELEDSPYLPQESFYELYNSADFCRNGVLYGYRHSNDVITSAAVKLSVDIIDQNSCQNMIKRKFVINKTSLICGNATDGLIEKLDLGSPLFANDKLVGVYVFGRNNEHTQGVFANVLVHRTLIENIINRSCSHNE